MFRAIFKYKPLGACVWGLVLPSQVLHLNLAKISTPYRSFTNLLHVVET